MLSEADAGVADQSREEEQGEDDEEDGLTESQRRHLKRQLKKQEGEVRLEVHGSRSMARLSLWQLAAQICRWRAP
eukprot:scaffold2429_cov263-Pinguiococcus_pyrenoidosus.AAC.1